MVRSRRWMQWGVAIALIGSVALSAAAAGPADLTGSWTFELKRDDQGQGASPLFTLKQQGTKVSGVYSSKTFGDLKVTGSVTDNRLTLEASSVRGKIRFVGLIAEGSRSIQGTYEIVGVGTGVFSGKPYVENTNRDRAPAVRKTTQP
jgi:hypothetical protein